MNYSVFKSQAYALCKRRSSILLSVVASLSSKFCGSNRASAVAWHIKAALGRFAKRKIITTEKDSSKKQKSFMLVKKPMWHCWFRYRKIIANVFLFLKCPIQNCLLLDFLDFSHVFIKNTSLVEMISYFWDVDAG